MRHVSHPTQRGTQSCLPKPPVVVIYYQLVCQYLTPVIMVASKLRPVCGQLLKPRPRAAPVNCSARTVCNAHIYIYMYIYILQRRRRQTVQTQSHAAASLVFVLLYSVFHRCSHYYGVPTYCIACITAVVTTKASLPIV